MENNNQIMMRIQYGLTTLAVITTLWACNGTDSASNTKDNDRTNGNDNGRNENASAYDQKRMNENAGQTKEDAKFMEEAAAINQEEIKLGKLAQQKGTQQHVKDLGKMMATEHQQALTGLTSLAKNKMVSLSTTETTDITDAYNKLNAKNGADFDKAYSNMMVKEHKKAIALFEKTDTETKDADVKAMTTSMIPKLKTHLVHAETCQKETEKW